MLSERQPIQGIHHCQDGGPPCHQRARWNLESEEYRYSRAAGEVVSINSDVYKEWKKTYNKVADFLVENAENCSAEDTVDTFKGVLEAIGKLPPQAQLKMLEFMAVPISRYFTEPEQLMRQYPIMFEFIRSHLR